MYAAAVLHPQPIDSSPTHVNVVTLCKLIILYVQNSCNGTIWAQGQICTLAYIFISRAAFPSCWYKNHHRSCVYNQHTAKLIYFIKNTLLLIYMQPQQKYMHNKHTARKTRMYQNTYQNIAYKAFYTKHIVWNA